MNNLYKITYKATGKKQVAYVLANTFGKAEAKFEKKITNYQLIMNIEFLAKECIHSNSNPLIK